MCIVVFFFSLCLFFFKQKTAYELRISDWSSDVCSSDLRFILFGHEVCHAHLLVGISQPAYRLGVKFDARLLVIHPERPAFFLQDVARDANGPGAENLGGLDEKVTLRAVHLRASPRLFHSEDRRGGKGRVSTDTSGGSPDH